MSKHRKVPSPALVISLIALFVALGSGAYAASKIGTSDLKRNAVTTPKLAKDAVKSSKVENGKLKGKDLADGTVGGSKLGTISEVTDTTTAAFGTIGTATATCPAGSRVLNGGFNTDSDTANQGLAVESRRVGNGWRASIYSGASNGLAAGNTLTVYAYCLEEGD